MQQRQPGVDAFKQSLALHECSHSYQILGLALYDLGKVDQGVKATQIFYRRHPPHLKIDPFLGARHKVTATRDLIQKIKDDLAKIQFAFHPSFFFRNRREQSISNLEASNSYSHSKVCWNEFRKTAHRFTDSFE